MRNCMPVKLRRRVCPDPPGQCKKPEDVWECLWHQKRYADLHKWFAGGITVVSFN